MSKFFRALEHADRERGREREPELVPSVEPDVHAAPPPRMIVDRAPSYGAPLAREADTHDGAFSTLLEPPVVLEPGEIDDHLVSVLEPTSVAAEHYRAIRLALETLRRERGTKLVAITSPGRGDGKTMTAINLAGTLAQASDARVAIVEIDLRHPSVGEVLGLGGGRGLSRYLLDQALGADALIERPAGLGFAVVVAGAASSMPYELLSSPRLATLLDTLRERFDFVIVDTPPALSFPDVGILRELVDGVLVVVRANRTPREHLRETLERIGRDRVLGVVFNDDGGAPRA